MSLQAPDTSPPKARLNSLEDFNQRLNSETAWVWLDAARDLADKAVTNFTARLHEDYQTTLGVDADKTSDDEAMIEEVETQCEELHAKIVRDLQTSRDSDVNKTRGYTGGYMSPVLGLFRIATCKNVDGFLDIASLENPLSFSSHAHNLKDGTWDKYGFDINKPADRKYAIAAIMSEGNSTPELYSQTA